ncbi:diacylglycerol kinase catalytic domain-containing protein [Coniochaeta sp. 2T2.1]|nr:diacylglycerol kinase catalytic domain-containing protein [Coniochaeta sp. 2T2.1]
MAEAYLSESVNFLSYADGEISLRPVKANSVDGGNIQLKEAEILFILRGTKLSESEGDYLVYSLHEEDAEDPFRLKIFHILNEGLPQQIIEKFLLAKLPEHLTCDATHRLSVVVSTNAGVRQAEKFYDGVLSPLLGSLGLQAAGDGEWSSNRDQEKYELIRTKSDQTVKELGKQLSEPSGADQARTIVLLSGDGGVVDLLNGPDSQENDIPYGTRKPTIVLLPMGTGNALFHSLHKPVYAKPHPPSPYVAGLRTLFFGHSAPLPTFEASFAPGSRLISYSDPGSQAGDAEEHTKNVSKLAGAIVASYGFHASLVWESDTPEYRKHGAQRFHMAAAELLKLGHAYDAEVAVRLPRSGFDDWQPRKTGTGDRFAYVLAVMVSNLEKTFAISPHSKPLDGKMGLVTFGDVGGEKTMDVMKAAYDEGAHVGMRWTMEDGRVEEVGYEDVEEVRVVVKEEDVRWRKVCIDGTIVEVPAGNGWMRVRKSEEVRLHVVVGRDVV